MSEELKHWGIFGMRWGIRRFQNPDGSLTPEGRARYGVGPARGTPGDQLSDDEMRNMTKRYKTQAEYYKARNYYFEQASKYAQYTKKDSIAKKFISKYLGNPFSSVMERNMEFLFMSMGASFLDATGSKYAKEYENFVFNKGKNKNKDQSV